MSDRRQLLDDASFRPAGGIDDDVDNEPGIYAIRLAAASALPEPFQAHLDSRETRLIYIGKATSLNDRMLGNELRGRGHGTFFRSLGAVLGYRPEPGSLAELKNKNNFTLKQDREAIVDWINEHLEVAWEKRPAAQLETIEYGLILAHGPLLNLQGNLRRLPELEALRVLCREIARTPGAL